MVDDSFGRDDDGPTQMDAIAARRARVLHIVRQNFAGNKSEAARQFGVSVSILNNILNGHRNLTARTARRIAQATGISYDELMGGTKRRSRRQLEEDFYKLQGQQAETAQFISSFSMNDIISFDKIWDGAYPKSRDKSMALRDSEIEGVQPPHRIYEVTPDDDAMASNEAISIPKGKKVFINPSRSYKPGNIVHVIVRELGTSVLRKIREELAADNKVDIFLDPLNKAYRSIKLQPDRGDCIIGIAIGFVQSIPY